MDESAWIQFQEVTMVKSTILEKLKKRVAEIKAAAGIGDSAPAEEETDWDG